MITDKTKHIPPHRIARGMNSIVAEGPFASAFFVITGAMWSSIFLIDFLRKMGASPLQIGILSSLPQVGSMFQVVASFLLERNGHRKAFCLLSSTLGKVFWLAFILVPLVFPGVPGQVRVWMSLAFILLANISLFFSNTSYISWIADFVPDRVRGKLIARKTMISSVVVLFIPLVLGRFFDVFSETHHYVMVFGGAVTLGLIGTALLSRVPDVPMTMEGSLSFSDILATPFRDRNFRVYILFNFLWVFSVMVMVPFVQVFLLEDLGCSKFFVGFLMVLNGLTNLLFTWIWGYMSDKFGRKPMIIICASFLVFTPLLWIAVNPATYVPLLIFMYAVSGMFWAGINISVFTLLMGLVPDTGKSKYFAGFYITVGLGGALAPVLGGLIVEHLQAWHLGPLTVTGFTLVLFIAFLVRFFSFLVLWKVKEPEEVSAGYVLKQFRMTNPFKVFVNLFLFGSNLSQSRKVAIIRRLGETKSPLVVDELIGSLDDADTEVREEAVRALGYVGHERAVDHLIGKLDDHSKQMQAIAARALGDIRDNRGVKPLLVKLQSPDSTVRSTAASALGVIGDPAVTPHILKTMKTDCDPQVVSSSAGALGRLGQIHAIWEILPVMQRCAPGVIRQELAAAIGNLLGRHGAFYELTQRERKLSAGGVSEIVENFFNRTYTVLEKERKKVLIMEREQITSRLGRLHNGNRYCEEIRELEVLCQRVVYQFICRISERERWTREEWRRIVLGTYDSQLERLNGLDGRLTANLWFIHHLAWNAAKPHAEEALLAVFALKNIGEIIRIFQIRKD